MIDHVSRTADHTLAHGYRYLLQLTTPHTYTTRFLSAHLPHTLSRSANLPVLLPPNLAFPTIRLFPFCHPSIHLRTRSILALNTRHSSTTPSSSPAHRCTSPRHSLTPAALASPPRKSAPLTRRSQSLIQRETTVTMSRAMKRRLRP